MELTWFVFGVSVGFGAASLMFVPWINKWKALAIDNGRQADIAVGEARKLLHLNRLP